MRTRVALCFEMPTHMLTLKGCLLWGLCLPVVPCILKHTFLWHSNQIVLSSVKVTLLKSLLLSTHCSANTRQATRFATQTIWQYWGSHFLHPHFFLAHLIIAVDNWTPSLLYRSFWSPEIVNWNCKLKSIRINCLWPWWSFQLTFYQPRSIDRLPTFFRRWKSSVPTWRLVYGPKLVCLLGIHPCCTFLQLIAAYKLLCYHRRNLFVCVSSIARPSGRNWVGLYEEGVRYRGHCCFQYMYNTCNIFPQLTVASWLQFWR